MTEENQIENQPYELTETFINAATVLLQPVYGDDALSRAQKLAARFAKTPLDIVFVAGYMQIINHHESAWWDSEDPKVRAVGQMQSEIMLLESPSSIIEDIEAGLGRELPGENLEEKLAGLGQTRYQVLAELKGEPPPMGFEEFMKSLGITPEMLAGSEVPDETVDPFDMSPEQED